MSHKTYELTLSFPKTKEGAECKLAVLDWLKDRKIDSYVEGVIDNLDVDHEYGLPDESFYEDFGGEYAPLILCSYDQQYISDLNEDLKLAFPFVLQITQIEMDTDSWQHGWKESFKEILTPMFRILPPWEEDPKIDQKICIRIVPGMAFGTGQHASTQVCLHALEVLKNNNFDFAESRILDVGTGSGILAIACMKLGAVNVSASDIDKDALLAAKDNAISNHVSFPVFEGSFPPKKTFDLVIANILYTVLVPMISDLAKALNPRGTLLLSGLIEEQAEDMIHHAKQVGLSHIRTERLNGWVALTFVK